MPTAGYSGTPLWKKLGLKEGMALHYLGLPGDVAPLIAEGAPPAETTDQFEEANLIHLFTTERAELEATLTRARNTMKRDAMLWVSWPKKSSKVPTDITEDTIREIARPMGLVDLKVCAVTEVWSGLKLMIRKELR
ncbi:MAG: DUF3052 family protein [Pseudomonadota bacterium]